MNNDFLKNMVESQKNMMAMWQDMYKNMAHTNDDPYTKAFGDFLEMQKNYMNFFSSFMQPTSNFGEMPFPFMGMNQWNETQKSMSILTSSNNIIIRLKSVRLFLRR